MICVCVYDFIPHITGGQLEQTHIVATFFFFFTLPVWEISYSAGSRAVDAICTVPAGVYGKCFHTSDWPLLLCLGFD